MTTLSRAGQGAGSAPLVGRGPQLLVIEHAVERLSNGHGGALAILGPAGVGKSRLAREALGIAARRGLATLTGRAVGSGLATPYRPLREALAPWARKHTPADLELGGHAHAPGILVPGWDGGGSDPVAPIFVAESLVRLLPAVSEDRPVLLLVEDMHWADEETLAAVEYLADAAESLPLLLVSTARHDEGPEARRVLRALAARGSVRLIQLTPLDVDGTRELASRCLGAPVSPSLGQLLVDRADGLPLFVEELAGALAANGGIAPSPEGLDVTPAAMSVLPDTVADTVAARLDNISDRHREVVESAALLGRSFDHDVLEGMYGADLAPALRQAMELALLGEDPDQPGRLRFRHALLRDGVLASTFPPRRAALARAVLDRLPLDETDGETLAIAVELAARAGDTLLATRLAIRRAAEAFDRRALGTAERALAEARHFAGADPELVTEIDVLQLRVASTVGRIEVVLRLGRALLTRLETTGPHDAELIEVHLHMAQAHLDEERCADADAHLDAVTPLVARSGDPGAATRLALESSNSARLRGDAERARADARQACDLARPHADQAELLCEALLDEGRAWLPDTAAARDRWTEALAVAEVHQLRVWRAGMLTELATLAVHDLRGDDELREAAELAHETGSDALLVRGALMNARLAVVRGDLDGALEQIRAAERLGVAGGTSRRAARDLTSAIDVLSDGSTADPSPAAQVLAALVGGDLGAARRVAGEVTDRGALASFVDIVAADPGPGAVADARAELPDLQRATAKLGRAPLLAALGALTWAEAATGIREPVLAAVATFDRLRLGPPAELCRAILRADGVPLPRRTASQEGVPDHLRALGVTARELDVLRLLAEGHTNRDVAAALYLSPRTVEKHVERLLLKTGAPNRTALAALLRPTG